MKEVYLKLSTLLIALLFIFISGCAIIVPVPEGKVMWGSKITSENTAFIKHGITTRNDVFQELGRPDMDFKALRTIVYSWEVLGAYMPWYLPYTTTGGIQEISKPYVLLINFDKEDRVSKFEIKERWPLDTIRGHAMKWIERENLDVLKPPTKFIASDIPKGKAVLYIFRPGGWKDAPLLHQPTVSIDGEVVAELRKGGYTAWVLKPGFHTVSVNPAPAPTSNSFLEPEARPVRMFSFDALPDTAYYLKVRVRYGKGALDPELTILSSEDAVPVLKELKPTW